MIKEYLDYIRSSGQAYFTSAGAQQALGISKAALAMGISRLRRKNMLAVPYRDFYVPIPPEYRSSGCIPTYQLLPPLMEHLKIPYYVCLLSAGQLYGAAHQQPQVTQVMVSKRMRPIVCGKVVINFIYKKDLSNVDIQTKNSATGYLKLSSPEATAMDLLLYPHQSGGLNNIATVLTELIEEINSEKLLAQANASNQLAWVQRLGFILSQIAPQPNTSRDECVRLLKAYIQEKNPSYIPLSSGPTKGHARNIDWHVVINTIIESDI